MNELETKQTGEQKEKDSIRKQLTSQKTLMFAVEFGFMIAVPLAVFAITGKWLAAKHHNQGFLYGGIVLALITSMVWFWKRINDIYNDYIN